MDELVYLPTLIDELRLAPFALLAGLLLLGIVNRFHTRDEKRILIQSFGLQVVGVFAQLLITTEYYGSGDILGYWAEGSMLANALRYDFGGIAPLLVDIFFHQPQQLPFELPSHGATAAQSVVSGFIQLGTGNTLYGSSLIFAYLSWLGRLSIYHAIKDAFSEQANKYILVAMLFVPSVVYWSGAPTKESTAIAFLGFLTLGISLVLKGRRIVTALFLVVVSATVVLMIKPYILLPFSIAVGVWYYWRKQLAYQAVVIIKPVFIVAASALIYASIIGVGRVVPEFAVDNLGNRTNFQQKAGVRAGGGSFYQIVPEVQQRGWADQALYAPWGLVTALFRPIPFESTAIIVIVSSFEQTTLFLILASALRSLGLRRARQIVTSSPALMLCSTFTVTFAGAVGLVTTNLGTLSRYRMPMLPFFATVILILLAASRGVQIASGPAKERRDAPDEPGPAPKRTRALRGT